MKAVELRVAAVTIVMPLPRADKAERLARAVAARASRGLQRAEPASELGREVRIEVVGFVSAKLSETMILLVP